MVNYCTLINALLIKRKALPIYLKLNIINIAKQFVKWLNSTLVNTEQTLWDSMSVNLIPKYSLNNPHLYFQELCVLFRQSEPFSTRCVCDNSTMSHLWPLPRLASLPAHNLNHHVSERNLLIGCHRETFSPSWVVIHSVPRCTKPVVFKV